MTTVSIAMATYNGAAYVEEQLQSFSAQMRLPEELVVTDDGSVDETVAIIENFAATAPFQVQVHRNPERLNYARNFERAISLCSGDIVFLSDQDDVWFPEKIETVLARFAANPNAQVIVNDQLLTDARLRHSGVTKLGNLKRVWKDSDGLIEGCCTAFRRAWSERLFPMPEAISRLVATGDMSHDKWINELAILLRLRLIIDRPLQYFRRTGENTTAWVLSKPEAMRFRDRVRDRASVPPLSAWIRRVGVLDAYEEFLTVHRYDLSGDMDEALRRIARERSSLQKRAELTPLPFHRRIAAIWRLWRFGGYGHFEGALSALSDFLRSSRS